MDVPEAVLWLGQVISRIDEIETLDGRGFSPELKFDEVTLCEIDDDVSHVHVKALTLRNKLNGYRIE